MQAGYMHGHTLMGGSRYTSTMCKLETWMERTILPRMSSYRVLHHDYMRHTCSSSEHNLRSYVPNPMQSPHNSGLTLKNIPMQTIRMCTACSVLCHSICTVSHMHSEHIVVIYASAGVATSAQALAWCMGGSLFVCVCSHSLGIFSDPPSICGDPDLRCFIDCV